MHFKEMKTNAWPHLPGFAVPAAQSSHRAPPPCLSVLGSVPSYCTN